MTSIIERSRAALAAHKPTRDAVRHVRQANHSLRQAAYSLDDGGYSCPELNCLSADTSALLAHWAGRQTPMDRLQSNIELAAIDWRRSKGRSY